VILRRGRYMLSSRALLASLPALVILFAGCGGSDAGSDVAAESTATVETAVDVSVPVIDDRFAVGGAELALRCFGKGSPTIIFEAGTDSNGIGEFDSLIRPLARSNMACTYDRLGTGMSDPPVERYRTMDDLAVVLKQLLDQANVEAPFVLVGSSGGGLLVARFAGKYREEVAGLVLLDVGVPNPNLDKELPGPLGWKNPEHMDWVDAERRLAEKLRPAGDIPVRVVVASSSESPDQSSWFKLSPRARQTTLQGRHDIYLDDPTGVLHEIRAVLDAIP
jgi:pimeloyl-ACP methyl ester carboxylesterase